MLTHKQRILKAFRGELPDVLPYAPRIDLWYLANASCGTLPAKYRDSTQNAISRAEGWALHHKYAEDLLNVKTSDAYLHRGIGIYGMKDMVLDFRFPTDVDIQAQRQGDLTQVTYHTPVGTVSATTIYNEKMQRLGISQPLNTEYLIKGPQDYPAVNYLFGHMDVVPNYERFNRWCEEMGEDGVPVVFGFRGGSPIHAIQKDLLDTTQFYFHYSDHQRELRGLAETLEPLFEKVLQITADSPAEAVMWGSNFDEMITYPPYFEKDILPWIRRASEVLGARGKTVMCHCDGENQGLMELVGQSGMHVAESICPSPMTKVPIEEYYRRWSDKLTLFGGIPSTIVLEESTSEADFQAYLDHFFKAVAPGRNLVVGIADQVPPNAVFDRLVRIGERVAREGRLPMEAGGFRAPVGHESAPPAPASVQSPLADAGVFQEVRDDVFQGDDGAIREHVQHLLDEGHAAQDILDQGLVAAMTVIGEQFKTGQVFIPEVLLSARAMNAAVALLGPRLTSGEQGAKGRILLGTVSGDMHNIGKNMVATMLRGIGFEVKDLGTNVPLNAFLEMVAEYKPDILGLSALLTTTMPEMKKVIQGLQEWKLRQRVKVIVGGAPLNEKFAQDIGADGYAPNAVEAVALSKRLMESRGRA